MQERLGPGVTPAKAVVAHQVLMEVLGGEAVVALAIEPLDAHRHIRRHPLRRRQA
jgi:hypothetical protein